MLPRSLKTDRLGPEEIAVQEALSKYQFTGSNEDFVPTRVLYGIYRRWMKRGQYEGSKRYFAAAALKPVRDHTPLNPSHFGTALRRVYERLLNNPHWRVRRTGRAGKIEVGFSHMVGPYSRKTKERNGSHEAPAAPSTIQRLEDFPEDELDAQIMA